MMTRNVALYLFTLAMVGFTVDGGIYSVVFNLFLLRLGYGPEFIGLVSAVGLVAFTVGSMLAAVAGSRLNNRRLVTLGVAVMTVACSALPFAEFVPLAGRPAWIIACYPLVFIGMALIFVNGPPYLMAAIPPAGRDVAFARQVALWSFAAFAGSLLAGFMPGLLAPLLDVPLSEPAPYRYPLLLAALALVPATVAMFLTSDITPAHAETESKAATAGAASNRSFVVLGVVRLFQVAAVAATVPFFNVYLDTTLEAPTALIGVLTATGRLLAAPVSLFMPKLSRRWGNASLVTWASNLVLLAILPLALVPHWLAAGIGFIGVTTLSAARYAAFLVFSMETVGPKRRAAMAGMSEAAAGVGFSLTSLIGGQVIVLAGFAPLFLGGAAFAAIGNLLFWGYFQARKGAAPQPVQETSS